MSTEHNPTHFEPSDYEIEGYFDNRPPEYFFGMSIEGFAEMRRAWEMDRKRFFPENNCYRCEHCGNGNVRYVVSAKHIPTGKNICFGDTCCEKLQFKNHDEFKAAQVRAKAEMQHKKVLVYRQYLEWLKANPDAATLIEDAKSPIHETAFIQDVIAKLKRFGSISEKQKQAVLKSMAQNVERANKPKEIKGDAPVGRQTVIATIVYTRSEDSNFVRDGVTYKMLAKLDNNATVWCTIPANLFIVDGTHQYSIQDMKGKRIELTATFELARNRETQETDKTHAFGKRPYAKMLEATNA